MSTYYHATTKATSQIIIKTGFKCSSNNSQNMFGNGIYFTNSPESALLKVHSTDKHEVIIAVRLNLGRLLTEERCHHDWNQQIASMKGFDSVQMLHCQTGPEICVYQPERITILDIYYLASQEIKNGKKYLTYVTTSAKWMTFPISDRIAHYFNDVYTINNYDAIDAQADAQRLRRFGELPNSKCREFFE